MDLPEDRMDPVWIKTEPVDDESAAYFNNNIKCEAELDIPPFTETDSQIGDINWNSDVECEEELDLAPFTDSQIDDDELMKYCTVTVQNGRTKTNKDTNDLETENATKISLKSNQIHEMTYKRFDAWITQKGVTNITEKIMMAYFLEKAKQCKPTSLRCVYSSLRTMIYVKRQVDISKFVQLKNYSQQNRLGYVPEKSKIFTRAEVARFLREADNYTYLLMKVALIVGISGARRQKELFRLTVNDVIDLDDFFVVHIRGTRGCEGRQFVITQGNIDNVNLLELMRAYISRRPPNGPCERFFIGYRHGRCMTKPIGNNTFASIPQKIAEYLRIPNPKDYTGYCYWKSSVNLLADEAAIVAALDELHIDNGNLNTRSKASKGKSNRKSKPKTIHLEIQPI